MILSRITGFGAVLRRSSLWRFVRLENGATAVEAALVAPVFIFFVSITMELAAITLSIRALDNATDAAARRIRVGDAVVRASSGAEFRQLICQDMPAFTDCNKTLKVRVVSSMTIDTLASEVAKASPTLATPVFNPGQPRAFVAVEATLSWAVTTPLFFVLPKELEFSSRTAFRNEPFVNVGPGGGP
jgi:Flp pilus assembly protein TadG